MPELPTEMVPAEIPIVDHCWCDLTSGKFFEPYDMSRWEMDSVVRLKEELEVQQLLKKRIEEFEKGIGSEDGLATDAARNSTNPSSSLVNKTSTVARWTSLLNTMFPFLHRPEPSATIETPVNSAPSVPIPTETSTPSVAPSISLAQATPTHLPLLRREYDLRSYGFEMVVDFGWSRKKS